MQRVIKAKNARSKRALQAREPKLEENAKKALFARCSTSSSQANAALGQLHLLKKPDGIAFNKANEGIHPFEDASALEFWSQKNDAALVVLGSHSKKRPHNLTVARMFGHQLLDMLELGVDAVQTVADLKGPSPTVGLKPLFHFAGDLFDSHPHFMLFKSLLLDLYHGEAVDTVDLQGLQALVSVSLGPAPPSASLLSNADDALKRPIHLRTYTTRFLKSGSRTPYVDLTPCAPALDLTLRRASLPAAERWKQATAFAPKRKAAPGQQDAAAEARRKKARRNVDLDAMGDKVGRLHVARQDLGRLQSRKMKGLKPARKAGA